MDKESITEPGVNNDGVGASNEDSQKKHGLTLGWAAVFVVANIAGSGVLPMARSCVDAGFMGMPLIVLCCLAAGFLGTRLARCWVFLEERKPELYAKSIRSPYASIGFEAYGRGGRILVSIVNNIGLFGVSIVFLILCADNINSIVDSQVENNPLNSCLWLLIIAAALLPLTWVGSPKEFWWAGLLALLTTVVACIMIITQAGIDAPVKKEEGLYYPSPTVSSFFLAFGSILFAFGGASSFPTIQNDMIDKSQFEKSVNIAFVGLLLIFFPVGAVGYFVYGGDVNSNILLSLSDGVPKIIGQLLISLHVFFAFLIISNPVYQELEELFRVPQKFSWQRVLLRTSLLLLALFIAESVPSFGKILDLVGGSTVSMMTFILPPIFYMKLAGMKGPNFEPTFISLHERVFLIEMAIVGAIGGIAVTYFALDAIINGGELEAPCYL